MIEKTTRTSKNAIVIDRRASPQEILLKVHVSETGSRRRRGDADLLYALHDTI